MLVKFISKLFDFMYLCLAFQSNTGCLREGYHVCGLMVSAALWWPVPMAFLMFSLFPTTIAMFAPSITAFVLVLFAAAIIIFCLLYYIINTSLCHPVLLLMTPCSVICLIWNYTYDVYSCLFIAYAYICTNIACSNIYVYLHVIKFFIYTCLHYFYALY